MMHRGRRAEARSSASIGGARLAIIMVGVLSLLALASLSTGCGWSGGATEATGAAFGEPYAPFRMTYVVYTSDGDEITKELTWRSQRSWDLAVVAHTDAGALVGSYDQYDRGVLLSYNAILDLHTHERTHDGADGGYLFPEQWFLPRAFTRGEGWEPLGRDANGYDSFRRLLGAGSDRYYQIYRHDPQTGLVMEVLHVTGSERTTVARALTYTPLGDVPPRAPPVR